MMRTPARFVDRWHNLPLAAGLMAVLLLVAGIAVIFTTAANNDRQKQRETDVQAQILAASVTAPLDFGDVTTAQDSMNALSLNPQVSTVGVYDLKGTLFAGYSRVPGKLRARLAGPSQRRANFVQSTIPVLRGGARIGAVYLEVVREPVSRRIARYSVIGLLVIMASLVVLVLAIAQAALRRANGELQARASALGAANAELQVQMDERAKAEEQLRHAHKMQALGQLTGGIAHDFNNLLTVIQGSADMLRRPALEEARKLRFVNAIVETAGRAAALTSQLLAFARRQPLRPEVMDLNQRIMGMTDLLDRALGERIAIRTHFGAQLCPVEADPAQLEAAVLNVAVNARDAMAGRGTLTIATADAHLPDGRRATSLTIGDSGCGIPAEMLNRIFEPFFTTKEVGKGTGLGLSQVYGFAAQSGGEVLVSSEVGKGTNISILLPCSEASVPKGEQGAETITAKQTGRVLVIDDNEDVGRLAEALLTELGHDVVRATNGAQALDIAAGSAFDAILTDIVMPGMDGFELADRLATVLPGTPVLFTTGYSDEIARSGGGGRTILLKPYRMDTLAEALNRVLRGA